MGVLAVFLAIATDPVVIVASMLGGYLVRSREALLAVAAAVAVLSEIIIASLSISYRFSVEYFVLRYIVALAWALLAQYIKERRTKSAE